MKIAFNDVGDFTAVRAAEAWCRRRGVAVGAMQGAQPRGLLVGDFDISKWRNLTASQRIELDGVMTGDMRHGPVTVTLTEPAYARCNPRLERCSHGVAVLNICERCDR